MWVPSRPIGSALGFAHPVLSLTLAMPPPASGATTARADVVTRMHYGDDVGDLRAVEATRDSVEPSLLEAPDHHVALELRNTLSLRHRRPEPQAFDEQQSAAARPRASGLRS